MASANAQGATATATDEVLDVSQTKSGMETAVQRLPRCRRLVASECGVTDADVGAIAAAVRAPRSRLRQVVLRDNDVSDAGAKTLAEALASVSSASANDDESEPVVLDLRGNTRITDAGVAALAHALRGSSNLRELDLAGLRLSNAAAAALSSCLAACANFQVLRLGANEIDDDGARALAGLLSSPLRELWLGHNAISDAGAAALAHSFALPASRLSMLELCGNPLSPRGIRHLARALECAPREVATIALTARGWQHASRLAQERRFTRLSVCAVSRVLGSRALLSRVLSFALGGVGDAHANADVSDTDDTYAAWTFDSDSDSGAEADADADADADDERTPASTPCPSPHPRRRRRSPR